MSVWYAGVCQGVSGHTSETHAPHLGQQHQQPVQRLDQEGIALWLEQLQPQVCEDGRLEQLCELVQLHQKVHRDL